VLGKTEKGVEVWGESKGHAQGLHLNLRTQTRGKKKKRVKMPQDSRFKNNAGG